MGADRLFSQTDARAASRSRCVYSVTLIEVRRDKEKGPVEAHEALVVRDRFGAALCLSSGFGGLRSALSLRRRSRLSARSRKTGVGLVHLEE